MHINPIYRLSFFCLLGLLLGATASLAQNIRYVKQDATGSGSSWTDASGDLQSQIDLAGVEQVWVATGVYKPTSNTAERGASFSMKNGVMILGGFAATGIPTLSERNPSSFTTVLSGDLLGNDGPNFANTGENSIHVISNPVGLTTTAVLDGFVIRGGNANGIGNTIDLTYCGGGVYNDGSGSGQVCSPSFRNCLFQANSAGFGGAAIFNSGNDSGSSSPQLINCSFQANSAGLGGAMYNYANDNGSSSPQLTNCSFQANSASLQGGAIYNNGTDNGSSSPQLTNCVLFGNGQGNTIYNLNASVSASYSLFENGETDFTGTNNLTGVTTSPFASTASVALSAGSPAIDQGNSQTYTTAGGPTTDLVGNPRIVGTNCQIDMGAVEFQQTGPTIKTSLLIQTQPTAGSAVCVGSPLNVSVSVTGLVSSYQWYKGSSPVVSQTTATLSLSNVTPADAGSYSVVVMGDCNSVTSTAFSLTVADLSSFTVNSVSVCEGQPASLLASACSGQVVWSTGATGSLLTVTAGSSTSTLTATCTVGSCSKTASGSVVVGQVVPPLAQILSLSAVESGCPVRLVGQGVGTSFVFTNGQGYVFSNVYRQGGRHDLSGLEVKRPGVYTLTAIYTNECGNSAPVTRTVTVERSCP